MSARSPLDRRQALAVLAAAALVTAGRSARAQVTVDDGYVYPARVQVGGVQLPLNGVGYRAVAWLKGYAAGLYLVRRVRTVGEVLSMSGPKRVHMRMLVEVPAEEFVKAFHKGVRRNAPAAELPALGDRMQAFARLVGAIGTVRKGDVVDLDFLPDEGMVFSLNGRARGAPIPGADFYTALLRIFLGERPVDPELKAAMLGGPLA